ncbi:MAG: sugar phosphate nucleotidyltransferase [Gemmatimonadales bacterium]
MKEASLTLVVLAAGLGSRYGGVKQLAPVGEDGATLMDYAVHDAWRAGFRRVVFVIRPELESAFGALIGARYRGRIEVTTALQRLEEVPAGVLRRPERTRPWGTAQAVLAARAQVPGGCAVLNADDFYGRDALDQAARFLRDLDPAGTLHAVIGYPMALTASPAGGVNRAVLVTGPEGFLASIEEVKELQEVAGGRFRGMAGAEVREIAGDALVSMNLWAFAPTVFGALDEAFRRFLAGQPDEREECYLPTVVAGMIDSGRARVRVLPTASRWCGITYAEDRPRVEAELRELVRRGEYPARLWS